jgi:hypothetical protein
MATKVIDMLPLGDSTECEVIREFIMITLEYSGMWIGENLKEGASGWGTVTYY